LWLIKVDAWLNFAYTS